MSDAKPVQSLPKLALSSYLDEMLMNMDPYSEVGTQQELALPSDELVNDEGVEDATTAPEDLPKPISEPTPEEPVEEEPAPVEEPVALLAASGPHSDRSAEPINFQDLQEQPQPAAVAYDWQESEFDCLLFSIGGLNLAIPMVLLGTIHPIGPLNSLFGQPKWLMGLMSLKDNESLRLVDTARIVLDARYRAEDSSNYQYAIGIYGTPWALACDRVIGAKKMTQSAIKWRSDRKSRPWLMGTLKEEMCALIDAQALCEFRLK